MKQINNLQTGNKFKKTEIGEIPVDWEVKTLSDAINVDSNAIVAGPFGSNLKVIDYRENGVPIIRLQNVDFYKFIDKDIKYISEKKAKELIYHSFISGDIALAKLGPPIGKSCLIPDYLKKGIVVADVVRIRADAKKTDKYFIMYILNSHYALNQLNLNTIGTTRPQVNLSDVRNLIIPFPVLKEQNKIAEILFSIDTAIKKIQRVIDKTKELKKGLMQELFTKGIGHKKFKKSELGKIPAKWEFKKLLNAVNSSKTAIVAGPFGSNLTVKDYRDEGVPIIRLQNIAFYKFIEKDIKYISTKKAEELAYHSFKIGDIVLSKMGAPIGKACIIPDKIGNGVVVADVVRIRVDKTMANKLFIMYMLNSPIVFNQLNANIIGTTRPRVNLNQVRDLIIPCPDLIEQEKIADILISVENEIENATLNKIQLEGIKKGLMESLLSGKIRAKMI